MSACHAGSLPGATLLAPLHFVEARLAHQHPTILNLMELFLYCGTKHCREDVVVVRYAATVQSALCRRVPS